MGGAESVDRGRGVGGLFLEALRLDREPRDAVRRRAHAALREGVGGFLLFGGDAGTVRDLVGELRREAAHPLLFAADLERGAGQQFEGLAELPPPAALAAHPRPEEAVREAGRLTGRGGRRAGVDLVLAPVLDLDLGPENPIVGTRSFGGDPERVAELGALWIGACQAEGVAACAKHFPGHGRTTEDSHLTLPVVSAERSELEADLLPFRRAAGEVAAVMTAHVSVPALGSDGPATLSPAVVEGLLRGEMGFGGVVVTDALVMAGVGGDAGTAAGGWVAVRALRAGCDLLLHPGDLTLAVRTVRQAAGRDPVLARRVEEARGRLEALHGRLREGRRGAGGDAGGRDEPESEASSREADREDDRKDAERADRLAEACLRAVGTGPEPRLRRDHPLRVRVVDDDAGWDGAGRPFVAALREAGWRVERWKGDGRSPAATGGANGPAAPVGPPPDLVLVISTPRAWKGRSGLSDRAARELERAVAEGAYPVVLGHPRLLDAAGGRGLCAWAAEAVLQRAAARWLDARAG